MASSKYAVKIPCLEIDFDGKKVCGEFSIVSPNPGSSVINKADDDSHDIITITKDGTGVTLNGDTWLDGLVLNIPLPVSASESDKYTQITVSTFNSLSGGTPTFSKTFPFTYKASRTKGTKKTVSFPVFSVSATKRVIFAPGNLQAKTTDYGANWTWHFAEHQYDYIGANSGNVDIKNETPVRLNSQNGTIDLFGFSTSQTYFGISNSWTIYCWYFSVGISAKSSEFQAFLQIYRFRKSPKGTSFMLSFRDS